jgi:N-formylglutamate deformylase
MQPSAEEVQRRIEGYWKPYHNQLNTQLMRLKEQFSEVLLLEAHSIASRVPRFFDGVLPEFNFGTNDGQSCGSRFQQFLDQFDVNPYRKVVNGRFKGGYITRHFGQPSHGIHAIQLELSQATYLDEESLSFNSEKAVQVQSVLRKLIEQLLSII